MFVFLFFVALFSLEECQSAFLSGFVVSSPGLRRQKRNEVRPLAWRQMKKNQYCFHRYFSQCNGKRTGYLIQCNNKVSNNEEGNELSDQQQQQQQQKQEQEKQQEEQHLNNENHNREHNNVAVLRIVGPDTKGIVAAFAQVLYGHGCNILDAEQHSDVSVNRFFQRISFDRSTMYTDRISLTAGIKEVCSRFNMTYDLNWGDTKKKVCIMVSKFDHALWELLLRHQAGELSCDIALIISNHEDFRHIANQFNIRFEVYRVTKENKRKQEDEELSLMKSLDINLVVLARYMQIITNEFCNTYKHCIINIHHSFLPAFVGAKPYHRAHARGVKLVGATAHYATETLDEGPIIEQDVARISHRHTTNDLIQKGRVLEREVLVRAVKAHLEDRIIVYENKCVVFGD